MNFINQLNERRNEHDKNLICHAPFRSMFFGLRGNVMTCSYNKVHLLGNITQQTIRQIWEGEKAGQIRYMLSQNELKRGCQNCAQILESGNFDSSPTRVYDNLLQNNPAYPVRMEFELDNACNLECIMCNGESSSSIRERREKRPPIVSPYGEDFLHQLDEFIPHLITTSFLGGEPFLIPFYFRIWERMMELNPNIQISIHTNGSILNSRVKKILEALDFNMTISLDSVFADSYSAIRVNSDLSRVKENIAWFSQYCQSRGKGLSISFCVMPQNKFEMYEIVNYCNSVGAHVFFNTVFFPPECSLMNVPDSEKQELVNFMEQHVPVATTKLEQGNKQKYLDLITQIKSWQNNNAASLNTIRQYSSIADLLSKLKMYLADKPYLSNSKQLSIYAAIQSSLLEILQLAEAENRREEVLDALLFVNLETFYQFFPNADSERTYSLLKEQVLKIM